MAYYDIMSLDAYGQYNRKLAKLTSLTTAVYWAELLDIVSQVVKKKKFTEEGFFKLDRKYVMERTTILEQDQLDLDEVLINLGVLERDFGDFNLVRVSLEGMAKLLIDDNTQVSIPKSKAKLTQTQKAVNKKEAVIANMKRIVFEEDADLDTKYCAWVDSVYSAGRFLTKAKIQTFKDTINKFTSDKKVILEVLDVGIQTGWDNAEWLINKYNSNKKNTPTQLTPQKTSTSVSTKFEF